MKTKIIILVTALVAAMAAVPAFAAGKGNGGAGGRGAGGAGVCPMGNVPGSGMCGGAGAGSGTCDGTQRRDRLRDGSCMTPPQAPAATQGNPNSTGTPLRDGSGKATAPGKGAKDGTGNQPRHTTNTSTQG